MKWKSSELDPPGKPEQVQPGGLDHLLGLAGIEVRVPPGGVHTEQLGVDRADHLADVDGHRREQLADLQRLRAREHKTTP